MARFLLALTATLLATSAFGADLASAPVEPMAPEAPLRWSGFYAGINVGYIGEDNGSTTGTGFIINTFGGANTAAATLGAVTTGRTHGLSGVLGGVQFGYNYQMNDMVFGIETDLQTSSRSRQNRSFSEPYVGFIERDNGRATNTQRYNYLGTVRGRVGYLVTPNLLLFATGGLAYGDKREKTVFQVDRVNFNIPAATARLSGSSWNIGWVLGGGAEYALDTSWSVKGEALYYDLGRNSSSGSITQLGVFGSRPFVGSNIRARVWERGVIARIGLNYKFGSL